MKPTREFLDGIEKDDRVMIVRGSETERCRVSRITDQLFIVRLQNGERRSFYRKDGMRAHAPSSSRDWLAPLESDNA